jgi:hypothetical protein
MPKKVPDSRYQVPDAIGAAARLRLLRKERAATARLLTNVLPGTYMRRSHGDRNPSIRVYRAVCGVDAGV